MEKTRLKKAFEARGLSIKQAAQAGCSYNTLRKHLNGERGIGAEAAVRYEILLGIPRWELRPDLWEQPRVSTSGQGGKTTDVRE